MLQSQFKEGIFVSAKLEWFKRLDLEDAKEKSLFVNLSKKLGAGEASCLAIAIQRKYDLLSDDMAVRKIALREGVRLSGSIGVLIELVWRQEIRFWEVLLSMDIFLLLID